MTPESRAHVVAALPGSLASKFSVLSSAVWGPPTEQVGYARCPGHSRADSWSQAASGPACPHCPGAQNPATSRGACPAPTLPAPAGPGPAALELPGPVRTTRTGGRTHGGRARPLPATAMECGPRPLHSPVLAWLHVPTSPLGGAGWGRGGVSGGGAVSAGGGAASAGAGRGVHGSPPQPSPVPVSECFRA